jgi:hypothetical protein
MRKYTRASFVGKEEKKYVCVFITCVWVGVRKSKIGSTGTVLATAIRERAGKHTFVNHRHRTCTTGDVKEDSN